MQPRHQIKNTSGGFIKSSVEKRTFSIYIAEHLIDQIKRLAEDQDRSKNSIISEILKEKLQEVDNR